MLSPTVSAGHHHSTFHNDVYDSRHPQPIHYDNQKHPDAIHSSPTYPRVSAPMFNVPQRSSVMNHSAYPPALDARMPVHNQGRMHLEAVQHQSPHHPAAPTYLPHHVRALHDLSAAAGDAAIPTYIGHIKTSTDAILLLAACDLPSTASALSPAARQLDMTQSTPPRRIQRRLLETERPNLIRSGSVFVWDEKDAGMRRWTDGRCWSASRVSGCFLTYRELEVRKRSTSDPNGPKSNQYKIDGLIKQSFSMSTTSGRKLHIVSYYTKRDLRENRLRRVSEDPRFVGEAGGEWGLSVDEAEYPDPVLALEEQQQQQQLQQQEQQHQQFQGHLHRRVEQQQQYPQSTRPHHSSVGMPHLPASPSGPASPRHPPQTRPMAPQASLTRHQTYPDAMVPTTSAPATHRPSLNRPPYSTGHIGAPISYPTPPALTNKRAWESEEDSQPHAPPYKIQRPTLKRLRSSSFTATKPEPLDDIVASTPAPGGRRLSDDLTSRMGSNKLLSMSNIRGDPASKADLFSRRSHHGEDPSQSDGKTEHDGASALLSLRSSFAARGSLGGSGSVMDTPTNLTSTYSGDSPDEPLVTPASGVSMPLIKRPSLPGRAPSDRDALNRLSIRF